MHGSCEDMCMQSRNWSWKCHWKLRRRSSRTAGCRLFQLFLCTSKCACTCLVCIQGLLSHFNSLYFSLQLAGLWDCFLLRPKGSFNTKTYYTLYLTNNLSYPWLKISHRFLNCEYKSRCIKETNKSPIPSSHLCDSYLNRAHIAFLCVATCSVTVCVYYGVTGAV